MKKYNLMNRVAPFMMFLFSTLFVVMISCNKDTKHDADKWFTGVVIDKNAVEGCGMVIRLDDGTYIVPIDIADKGFVLVGGAQVNLKYEETDTNLVCRMGAPVRITSINTNGCNITETFHLYPGIINYPLDTLGSVSVDGDLLRFEAAFSGGCQSHSMRLVWDGSCCDPVINQPLEVYLFHDNLGDACEMLIQNQYCWNLSNLRIYGQDSVVVNLNWLLPEGPVKQSVVYRY